MLLQTSTYANTIVAPDGSPTRRTVEVRIDPLTNHLARLVGQSSLLPVASADLVELAAAAQAECPFCPERIEQTTPLLAPQLCATGRIRVGETILFPNLMPYAEHSVVAIYGANRHLLRVQDLTERLLSDNLGAQVEFFRAVRDTDPAASWISLNANHLAPAGSSVFHPHTQGLCHAEPTPAQRLAASIPTEVYVDLIDTERRLGARWLADTGRVRWTTAFAPLGPGDVRGYLPGLHCPTELDADTCVELAVGLVAVLRGYAALGITSFNLALLGVPPQDAGGTLTIQLVARSGLAPYYRSDVTYLERLHGVTVTGMTPEIVAEELRPRFGQA